jgi:hypothetical protein
MTSELYNKRLDEIKEISDEDYSHRTNSDEYAEKLWLYCLAEHYHRREQKGVTVPSNAAITFAPTPWKRPRIFFVRSGGK